MSRAQTRSAPTPHGDVAYEVVTCANCGTEVVPEDAVPVGVGTETYVCTGLPFCRESHERPREHAALCTYCAEATLGYTAGPDGVGDRLAAFSEEHSALGVGLWLGVVVGVALAVGLLTVRLVLGIG